LHTSIDMRLIFSAHSPVELCLSLNPTPPTIQAHQDPATF
jgi:hypothetical protein